MSILRDILRTVQEKEGKAKSTHILYGANLSHDRLKKYLETLEAEELIKKNQKGDQVFYEITQKGLEFLSTYNKMNRFFNAFGVSI